jgi:hypothetical protein
LWVALATRVVEQSAPPFSVIYIANWDGQAVNATFVDDAPESFIKCNVHPLSPHDANAASSRHTKVVLSRPAPGFIPVIDQD